MNAKYKRDRLRKWMQKNYGKDTWNEFVSRYDRDMPLTQFISEQRAEVIFWALNWTRYGLVFYDKIDIAWRKYYNNLPKRIRRK